MADFAELRERLKQARGARAAAASATALTRERLKRLRRDERELGRVFDGENGAHERARRELAELRARAESELKQGREAEKSAVAFERGALAEFAVLADPRESIAHLDDSTPILLMPVRLETRFKTVTSREGVSRRELWVRIYPDDCWIDSFEPMLTATEVSNAQTYWTSLWQAGGVEANERAAWRILALAHGSGRARYIVTTYRPSNLAEQPVKALETDVILTIATSTPLAPAEATAASAFFRDSWLADGDAAKLGAARAAFDAAVGAVRAGEIAAAYVPANFDAPLPAGTAKSDVSVSVAVVIFPAVETKETAWSAAPKAVTLPERFVFLGYETVGSTTPLVVVTEHPVPSPLPVAPDPGAPEEEQLHHDEDGNLVLPDELAWIADFEKAEAVGMALRIELSATQAERGFARVLVVGLRSSADEKAAQAELETLFSHHAFSRPGLALLPQGTPTNNTEGLSSGHARLDDPDQSFDDAKAPLFSTESDWFDKRDGQWLAEYLGLDPGLFSHVHRADATDQAAARAMNAALFPATLGYWMQTLMTPVFSRDAIRQTREFFTRYVVGSGACPAIRIGSQPYGILPTTAFSRMRWFEQRLPLGGSKLAALARDQDPMLGYLARLHALLSALDADRRERVSELPFVGKTGDPHALLLDILGLHSGSVEWAQRYAESFEMLFNRLKLSGFFVDLITLFDAVEDRAAARTKLGALGYHGEKNPSLLDLVFSAGHQALKGGVVDDRPLSETDGIRAYTPSGQNYVEWLLEAAGTSLDALYEQAGFLDDKPPAALLYLTLRHALQLGYHDSAVGLRASAGLYTAEALARAYVDDSFLHIRDNDQVSESRYQPLYAPAAAVTGSQTQPLHRFIAARIAERAFNPTLSEQVRGLRRLRQEPTARLERVFADHVDCCSYRLDAWLLGLVNYELALMRELRDEVAGPARPGVYLGAYAWLEDLRPDNRVLSPVVLDDRELAATFQGKGEPPLVRDSTNQGYVHAPSLNHAVAAAVLRNGFISAATPENRETLAVNLTSERVRKALALLEGIRAGQSLADLLGYQLERGLHDRHGLVEVDKFIYKLRKAFPLRGDRLAATKTPEGVSIEAIEARNVVDGLALAEHVKKAVNKSYPWDKSASLPSATTNETAAIDAEVTRLLDSLDAVADLALSEGVYQAVLGNYDRVASTYDAYARGNFPPEPDVIRTPTAGVGLTHRVALHLESGSSHLVSPVPGVPMTPRARAEPALNRWLERVLPPQQSVGCVVAFRDTATGTEKTRPLNLKQLGLQPVDWLALIRDDDKQAMTELDDRIARFALGNFPARPDEPVRIRYLEKGTAAFSVFELMPLVRNLRRLVLRSRPLRATDLALMNEARSEQDEAPSVDKARLVSVRTAMVTLRDDLAAKKAAIEAKLADLANRRPELIAEVDATIADVTDLLARAATFVIAQAGWGFAFDFRTHTYAAILAQCAELVARWDDRLAQFQSKLLEVAAAADEEQKLALLADAERLIATSSAPPPLPASGAYLSDLTNVRLPPFVAKRDQFAAVAASTDTAVSTLLAGVRALLPIDAFEFAAFELTPHEDTMIRFYEDTVVLFGTVIGELERRLSASQGFFDQHDAAASASARVEALELAAKALLGEDFRIIPEFSPSAAQSSELLNALADSASGALFDYLVNPPEAGRDALDFPVDTWLYGMARVREKMHAWEQVVVFAGALGRSEPELTAVQLPFTPNDRWLGLEFPDQKLDRDRLLYTAHFTTPFTAASKQCGLLLDEWSETIPLPRVDTGITFHHDRPNSEAPQSMLLVTPPEFRGVWRWDDLVAALNETLDLAKRRTFEPKHVEDSALAGVAPATVSANQARQLTIGLDFARNNRLEVAMKD